MKINYLLFILCFTSSFSQSYTLEVPEGRYQVDQEHRLILCNIQLDTISDLSIYDTVNLSLDVIYNFEQKPEKLTTTSAYDLSLDEERYKLYFSKFPLIAINAPEEIIDEPKRYASFVYADSLSVKRANAGVELRGGSSQGFPKKTYDLEFWEDKVGDENIDMQFGNLREDDDWILDALYNEPLRLRAYTTHKLWLAMHTPYYLEEEEKAKAGADVMYVEVFLNNKYNGVYMLSEQVDKKQLRLKSFKNDEIRGELYKAEERTPTSFFQEPTGIDNSRDLYGGFELKLPDADDEINWQNLNDFVAYVGYSDYETFHEKLQERVRLDNAIDYFIFLNTIGATDNRGKNFYLARYTKTLFLGTLGS